MIVNLINYFPHKTKEEIEKYQINYEQVFWFGKFKYTRSVEKPGEYTIYLAIPKSEKCFYTTYEKEELKLKKSKYYELKAVFDRNRIYEETKNRITVVSHYIVERIDEK